MKYWRQNEIRNTPLIFVKAQSIVTMRIGKSVNQKECNQRYLNRRAGRADSSLLVKGIVS